MPLNRPFFKRFSVVLILFCAGIPALYSQETASKYFESVSERYESIEDYTADLAITKGDVVQTATVMYKTPNLLRLDFVDPEGMVMAVDGEILQVWVPDYSVTFSQPLRKDSQEEIATLATAQGLELMQRYYTVAYTESPDPVPLDPGSSELVVKLKLDWKSNNEGFKQLELSIDTDRKIRRVKGITTSNDEIVFDFANMVVNKGIPDVRFQYESPPTGNTIENFLFDPES